MARNRSMKWKIICSLLACWMVPFAILIAVMGVYTAAAHSDLTANSYVNQMEFNLRICAERLNMTVFDSRQVSYDGAVLKAIEAYKSGHLTYDQEQKQIQEYLNTHFQNSERISDAIVCIGGSEELSESAYSVRGNGSYQQIRRFWQQDAKEVLEAAKDLDTATRLLVRDGTLYQVRNIVDNHYQVNAVLVLVLNQDYCLDSIAQYPMQEAACIWLDDEQPILIGEKDMAFWTTKQQKALRAKHLWLKEQLLVTAQEKGDNYALSAAMLVNTNVSRYPFAGYPFVVGAMVAMLVAMLYTFLRIFRREVTEPVEALSAGLSRIEQGELGYQMEGGGKTEEFARLSGAVNHMSRHLKEQFERIYEEEVALRDAKIMALQSHINPHFLNNTMEIINWEARLGGNETVCHMIEALSKVLDAAMDRGKRPEVLLREEIEYENAYLYIMKERLGDRLQVEQDIPDELLTGLVPRLILQPVIENAIEHGVVANGGGTVKVRGRHDERFLYLEVENDGTMTREDAAKIGRLLDLGYNTSKEPSGNLGIANVNQRLYILFGEPCGLTITQTGQATVLARLTIPWK